MVGENEVVLGKAGPSFALKTTEPQKLRSEAQHPGAHAGGAFLGGRLSSAVRCRESVPRIWHLEKHWTTAFLGKPWKPPMFFGFESLET